MTIADTKALMEEIAAATSDPETAHSLEDDLRATVLLAIAAGRAENAPKMAAIALSASGNGFPRWYA